MNTQCTDEKKGRNGSRAGLIPHRRLPIYYRRIYPDQVMGSARVFEGPPPRFNAIGAVFSRGRWPLTLPGGISSPSLLGSSFPYMGGDELFVALKV